MIDVLREFYSRIHREDPDASVEFVYDPQEDVWSVLVNGAKLYPSWKSDTMKNVALTSLIEVLDTKKPHERV